MNILLFQVMKIGAKYDPQIARTKWRRIQLRTEKMSERSLFAGRRGWLDVKQMI